MRFKKLIFESYFTGIYFTRKNILKQKNIINFICNKKFRVGLKPAGTVLIFLNGLTYIKILQNKLNILVKIAILIFFIISN